MEKGDLRECYGFYKRRFWELDFVVFFVEALMGERFFLERGVGGGRGMKCIKLRLRRECGSVCKI